jgi:hypothetical protein
MLRRRIEVIAMVLATLVGIATVWAFFLGLGAWWLLVATCAFGVASWLDGKSSR